MPLQVDRPVLTFSINGFSDVTAAGDTSRCCPDKMRVNIIDEHGQIAGVIVAVAVAVAVVAIPK